MYIFGLRKTRKRQSEELRKDYAGRDIHDICHLYITYGYIGYGYVLEEKIEIADMCFYDEKQEVYNKEVGEEIFDEDDETRKIAEVQKYPVTIKDFL